jgi:hypothetical protein
MALAQVTAPVAAPASTASAGGQFTTTYPYPGEYTQSPEAVCAGSSFDAHPCPDQCNGNQGCYFSADYLVWKVHSTTVPPITLIHSVPFFIPALGGTTNLDFVNTIQLPTGLELDYPGRSGVLLKAGAWLDDRWGVEATYFQIEERKAGSAVSATDVLNINTPFFTTFSSPIPGAPAGTPPVFSTIPSTLPGIITVNAAAVGEPNVYGAELSIRHAGINFGGCFKFQCLAGFRFVNADEFLNVTDSVSIVPTGPLIVGSSIVVLPNTLGVTTFDHIGTQNRFYGAQVGGSVEGCWGNFFVNGTAKFAVGAVDEHVNIASATSFVGGGTQPGGALTSALDVGNHSRVQASILTDVGFNVGYQICDHCRAYVGYSLIYMPDLVRPGAQVGTALSTTHVTFAGTTTTAGIPQSAFRFSETELTLQGLNFGLEFRY